MSESAHPAGAVFVSYASQDADAAERICAALRAAGVEVWFDRSELRGGDAWDAQIRKRIHNCALFLPVISSHTDARIEGYFRREWNLASHRLLDMAHDAPFLVPVVVDDTREIHARVPDEFLRAQWTRLPEGNTPPAFVQRVRQLLGGDIAEHHVAGSAATRLQESESQAAGSGSTRHSRDSRRLRVIGLISFCLILVLGAAGLWYFQGGREAPIVEPTQARVSPLAVSRPDQKSIAVLPFVDMSEKKDQEYFADGLSEELLNLLAKVPDLQVAARASSFYYKGKNVKLPEMARELRVAHFLDGSVRRSANRVRIMVQLIRADDGYHMWSETYDRTPEDVFAIQEEIAVAVVSQLKATLLGAAPKVAKTDPEAYALFLKARQWEQLYTSQGLEQSLELYQQALAIDSNYAAAWNGLAVAYFERGFLGAGPRNAHENFRLARDAANKALVIDPDDSGALVTLSHIARVYDNDLAVAARYLSQALLRDPSDLNTLRASGLLLVALGRLDDAIAVAKYCASRDPLDPSICGLGWSYWLAGRLDEALIANRTTEKLSPDIIGGHYDIGAILLAKGDYKDALAVMQEEPNDGWRLLGLALAYHALGQAAASDEALAELVEKHETSWSDAIARVYAFRGESDRAFKWLDKAVANRATGVVHFPLEPFLRNLHSDPRWLPFLRKIGKTPEQLSRIKFEVKLPR